MIYTAGLALKLFKINMMDTQEAGTKCWFKKGMQWLVWTIAGQVEGIVTGIDGTTAAMAQVGEKANQMKATASRLRELIGYFRFIR